MKGAKALTPRKGLVLKQIFCAFFITLLVGCATRPKPDFILLPDNPPPARVLRDVNVALVLGGGGARGIAHAGVLDVLEQHDIPIDLIVGSSVGSIIGALYADDPNAQRLKQKIIALTKWDVLDLDWFASVKMFWKLSGPVSGNALKLFVQNNIRAKDFNQLTIPLAVVTTEINTGETYVIQSGHLVPALHASSAIPMLFSPVHLYGKVLVDGGVASPVPVEVAKQFKPRLIIAVDIGTSPDYGRVANAYQAGYRAMHISYFHLAKWQNKAADIVIHPAIDDFSMFDDSNNEILYQAGRAAALEALPTIQAALKKAAANSV